MGDSSRDDGVGNSWVGHSWVEGWLGRWVAGLGADERQKAKIKHNLNVHTTSLFDFAPSVFDKILQAMKTHLLKICTTSLRQQTHSS